MISPRHAFIAVVALTLAGACHKEEAPADEAAPVVTVQTIVVKPQAFTETVGAIGTVVPRAARTATLSAAASSRVVSILVTAGQTVSEGQPLIELEPGPFRSATTSARAAVTAAQSAYDRQQRLNAAGIAARKDLETATADLARARADLDAAQRLETLATIKSPISGVVTRLMATMGAAADVSQPLIEIADPTALDILLSVTPTDAARVHAGSKVSLRAGQGESGDIVGVGSVMDVAAMVDSAGRGVAVRVQTPTMRRPLRIGETVYGAIVVGTHASAVVIPVEALVPEGEGFKVFVVDSAQVAHETEVEVGARSSGSALIESGLKAGQRIVTVGAYGLEDGVKVAPPGAKAADEKDEEKKPADSKKPTDLAPASKKPPVTP